MPTTLERVSSRKPPARDREAYRRLQRDLEFLSESRDRLIRKFAEQWVAVFNESVVAHSPDLSTLLRDLDRQGISPDQVIVDFLTKEQRALIL